MHSEIKSTANPLSLKSRFYELLGSYSNHTHIYTDGSKEGERVAAAAVVKSSLLCCRLPDGTSVFTAELTAIILALNWIVNSANPKSVVFSASLASLQAIKNKYHDNPLVQDIITKCHKLHLSGKQVTFFWVPSHVGIAGNEGADRAAKVALSFNVGNHSIPYTDFKSVICHYIKTVWQTNWSTC